MTEPASTAAPAPGPDASNAQGSAPTEQGWGKLLIALAAFFLLPRAPQLAAILPIEQTMLLFVPALASCALVGWWAGGRIFLAIAWIAIAVLMSVQPPGTPDAFFNLSRGWSLLLAGSFGLVCLFNDMRPFFPRALVALGMTLLLAMIMSMLGPVSMSQSTHTVGEEFARRNHEFLTTLDSVIQAHPKDWTELTQKMPNLTQFPEQASQSLTTISQAGVVVFPALLALESIAALALAWATYHRFSRARLGPPLRPLREFRFNDQLVWGLIVGLTVMLLPTLTPVNGAGKNLLVFFGALYALRGLGVLSWFMRPGRFGIALGVGFLLLAAASFGVFVVLAFMMLAIAALALGLGDTWADWRSRARPSS